MIVCENKHEKWHVIFLAFRCIISYVHIVGYNTENVQANRDHQSVSSPTEEYCELGEI